MSSLTVTREQARITKARAEIILIANAVEAARAQVGNKLLSAITNSQCTACGSTVEIREAALQESLDKISAAGGGLYKNIELIKYDPANKLYELDENETASGACARDRLRSIGLNRQLIYYFEFISARCQNDETVTSQPGFNY